MHVWKIVLCSVWRKQYSATYTVTTEVLTSPTEDVQTSPTVEVQTSPNFAKRYPCEAEFADVAYRRGDCRRRKWSYTYQSHLYLLQTDGYCSNIRRTTICCSRYTATSAPAQYHRYSPLSQQDPCGMVLEETIHS